MLKSPDQSSSPRAMSIVEMLLVIGIIGILMAITLPSLNAARTTSRISAEQNAARQLAIAYIAYTNLNRDALMPGYLPACPDMPQFCFTVQNAQGDPISTTALRRYPWRIAPYLSFQIDGLFVNDHREVYHLMRLSKQWDYEYAVSMAPSFGLNTEWLGGDASQKSMGFLNVPIPGQKASPFTKIYDFRRFYITRITQTVFPDRLIVFASARGPNPVTPAAWGGTPPAVVEGHFRVTSPFLTPEMGYRWDEKFTPAAMPAQYGFLSPRYRNSAIVSYLDGGTGMLSANDIRDMRHWANWADTWDWTLPKLQP